MRISYENPALGIGGFGRVYRAHIVGDWEGSRVIALKKVRTSHYVEYPGLLHEACGLVLAKDHPSIPQVFGWGRSQFYEYLAMEILDCSLFERFKSKPLTRRNFVSLVLQMFAAVKHVHASGILHCDINLNNFMLGFGENAGRVYLIDFNLWTAWRTFDTQEHFYTGERGNAAEGFRGTYSYASINCHLDGALSRRDDFESLAYSIFELYAARLPWSGEEDSDRVLKLKQIWKTSGALQGSCEYPLGDLVHYAQSLDFLAEPDYDGWREAFWRVDNGTADFPKCDPLYDPADRTEEVPRNMDFVDWESPQGNTYNFHVPNKQNMGRMEHAPGSNHGYRPDSSASMRALTMKPEDTIDGRRDLIRDFVQHISQPPTTRWPSLEHSCSKEEMRGFDDPIPFKIYVQNTTKEEPKRESEQESGSKRAEAEMGRETGGGEKTAEGQPAGQGEKGRAVEGENKEGVHSGRGEEDSCTGGAV